MKMVMVAYVYVCECVGAKFAQLGSRFMLLLVKRNPGLLVAFVFGLIACLQSVT